MLATYPEAALFFFSIQRSASILADSGKLKTVFLVLFDHLHKVVALIHPTQGVKF